MENIFLFIFALFLIFGGLAGVVLPILPGGVFLSWAGYFVFAIFTGFQKISLLSALVFLGIAVVISVIDFAAPLLGAKKRKASRYGITGAFLGSIFGVLIFNLPGIILGPFIGAVLGELLEKKNLNEAAKVASGTFVGFLAGAILKTIFILIMAGFLIIKAF
jgi:uncharacterized protein